MGPQRDWSHERENPTMTQHRPPTCSEDTVNYLPRAPLLKLSRRDLCSGVLASAGAFAVTPRGSFGTTQSVPSSEKINVAVIGTGCHGTRHLKALLAHQPDVQVVALCDVNTESNDYRDFDYKDGIAGLEPARRIVERHDNQQERQGRKNRCATYRDFRVMLERQKDIDAVLVATPDHSHATVAMAAIKMGKHIYCEKPLTHAVAEARALTDATRVAGVASQMGNQLHSSHALRRQVEIIQSGILGPVREVHVWCGNTGWHGPWSQISQQRWAADSENFTTGPDFPQGTPPVPDGLDWDLWLGPAPYRPYHPAYLPFKWRGWWQFGSGTLGDMGCHMLDIPFWGLGLEHPIQIEASSTTVNTETAPVASVVHYLFPARDVKPPVKLTWYDGGLQPPRPEELSPDLDLPDFGLLLVGENGKLLATYNGPFTFLPETLNDRVDQVQSTLPRVNHPNAKNDPMALSLHHREWLNACKGGPQTLSNFEYAGLLTETVLLGVIAVKTGKPLHWDAEKMQITNFPEANEFVRPTYRQGWTL